MEEKSTYPYPSRITEFLARESPFPEIEPLDLINQEREKVLGFEAELFEKLEPLRKLTPGVHTVYPGYFLTEEGWQEAVRVYGEVDEKVKDWNQPTNTEEAIDLFFQIQNLANLSLKKRREIGAASMKWARDEFIDQFLAAEGSLDKVENPHRISRIVNLQALKEKAAGYRELKKEIKKRERELVGIKENLSEAKRIVLRLYRRYLNVLIAELYSQGAVLARQPRLSLEEKEILNLVRGRKPKKEIKKDRLAYPGVTRTLERMDHFLRGAGLEIQDDGFLATIPEELSRYIEKKCQEFQREETEEYKKYKRYKVTASQAKQIAEAILRTYGLRDWQVRIRPDKTGFMVNYREEGEVVKTLDVPGGLNRNLPDLLRVLSHEIEGHILRHDNREKLNLRLIQEFSTGRDLGFSEAAAVRVEEVTVKIFDMVRAFTGVYYWALKERERGGSFKDCFRAALLAQAGGEERVLKDWLINKEEFLKQGRSAFRRTLRIFRAGRIPLEDKTSFLVNSEELSYHETPMIVERLAQLGLDKLLFIPGVDVYSLIDLQRLGVLNWEEILTPRFVVAEEIWPKIKKELDEGRSLQGAINSLES